MTRTTPTEPSARKRTAVFALDPYFIDECTFTRNELLQARGMSPRRTPARRRPATRRADRPRSSRAAHAA